MRPQRYRHRIGFQKPVISRDGDDVTTTWTDVDNYTSVPADVLTGAGKELLASGTKLAETDARINLPWFPDLEPTWRVVWEGFIFDITSISSDRTARKEYRLTVQAGLSDGE